ncbi:MAG: DUF4399 domain-containing protein [Actinobacteria bacterium]|nr:DUF4399 domain-containing protein [Actinomycetota bacterium]
MHMLLRLALAIALGALFGCSADTDSDTDDDTSTGTSTEVTEPDFSVAFESPSDGDTVSSPVLLEVSAERVTLEPAGEVNEGAGHLHVAIDEDCVEAGQTIPTGDSYVHFGAEPLTERTIELEPGERTLCLQLSNGVHVATAATDTITVNVK